MSDTPSTGKHARRPVRRTAALAVVALLVGLLTAPVTAAGATGAATNAELRNDRYERTVLARVNRVRARHDLPRLRVLPCVDVVAERRLASPVRPARAARLDARRLRRTCDRTLELTVSGRGSARVVTKSWLRRPESRSALLEADARFVGVAAAPGRGRWRGTLLLVGAPASGPTEGGGSLDGGTTTAPADSGADGGGVEPTDGTAATDGTEPTTDDEAAAMDDLELAVLAATNRRRANHDLAPLQPSSCAAGFAGEHSATMAATGTFAHAELADLQSRCGGARLAENIAMGSGAAVTAQDVLQVWMGSEGHRANILDPDLTHLGVGVVVDAGSGRWYATQDFLGNP